MQPINPNREERVSSGARDRGIVDEIRLRYLRCLAVMKLTDNQRKWYPRWFEAYVRFNRFHLTTSSEQVIPVTQSLVIKFLQSLRDTRVPAWRRLQAAEAIAMHHNLELRTADVDFNSIRKKLLELSAKERRGSGNEAESKLVAGEGNPGWIDGDEPKAISDMRRRLRFLHHPISTETAYVGWLKRFIRHVGDERLERYGADEVADFLTELAVVGEVAASTQNQALNGLLFYYKMVLGHEISFINAIRAKVSTYRPTVLSRREICQLAEQLSGTAGLMFWLMYGAGLRHRECRTLRVKDVSLDDRQILVRDGKCMKGQGNGASKSHREPYASSTGLRSNAP